jgi:hypothetical protein
MKKITAIILIAFLLGCMSNTSETSKTIETEKIVNTLKPQVAIDFFNAYIANCNKYENAIDIIEWTKASTYATSSFKKELETLVEQAWKEDPELGLGYDPILYAQDYPDEGVELLDFNSETGYLTVKGIKWESFQVSMKVLNENGKTLVDGCGAINMSKELTR